MTELEAINIINEECEGTFLLLSARKEFVDALVKSIEALDEIQQYRKIGTVEECRDAIEKQNPKKPDYEGDGYDDKGELVYDTWICPNCGRHYELDYDDYEHCPKCGQAIQRDENLEGMEDE